MVCKVFSQSLLIIMSYAYICQAATLRKDELQINFQAQEGNVRTLQAEQIKIGDFDKSLSSAFATAGSTATSVNGAPSFSGSTAFSYQVSFPNIKTFADLNKNPLKIPIASSQSNAAAGDSFANSNSQAVVRTTPDFKTNKIEIQPKNVIANELAKDNSVAKTKSEKIGDFNKSLSSASATAGTTTNSLNGAPSGSISFNYSVNFPNLKTDLNQNPLKIIRASSQSTAAAIDDSSATSNSHAFVRTTPDFKTDKIQILSADAIANAFAKDNSVAKATSKSFSFDRQISDLLNQLGDTKLH